MPFRARPRAAALTVLAALGLTSAVTGGLTGVGSAAPADPASTAGTQAETVSTTSTCPFAAGPQKVTVETSATFPTQLKTGATATIDGFSAKLVLPREAALALLPAGATAGKLQGGLRLDLAVRQDKRDEKVPVPLTVAPTALPETGDVTLLATGEVPAIALNAVGPVTFAVTAPTLALQPPPAEGETAKPADQIACTLDPDQKTTLSTVLVVPPKKAAPKPHTAAVDAPEDEGDPVLDELPPSPLTLVRIVTTSTVRKLGAKVASPPGFMINGALLLRITHDTGELYDTRVTGSTVFKPVTATFLGFGFVPVSADVEFLPVDYQNSKMIDITGTLTLDENSVSYLTSHLQVMARLSGAKVNGVPLELGDDCVTAKPIEIDVTGPYEAFGVGHIGTDPNSPDPKFRGFTLPAFKNCGSGSQQLSPLLTGMSSGPGNQVTVDTYNLMECHEPDQTQCPPGSTEPPPDPAAAAAAAKKAVAKKPK